MKNSSPLPPPVLLLSLSSSLYKVPQHLPSSLACKGGTRTHPCLLWMGERHQHPYLSPPLCTYMHFGWWKEACYWLLTSPWENWDNCVYFPTAGHAIIQGGGLWKNSRRNNFLCEHYRPALKDYNFCISWQFVTASSQGCWQKKIAPRNKCYPLLYSNTPANLVGTCVCCCHSKSAFTLNAEFLVIRISLR